MHVQMPIYTAPDFAQEPFASAPDVATTLCEQDGVAPAGYHSTSMYPEYFKVEGEWLLAKKSRMDSCVVYRPAGADSTAAAPGG